MLASKSILRALHHAIGDVQWAEQNVLENREVDLLITASTAFFKKKKLQGGVRGV